MTPTLLGKMAASIGRQRRASRRAAARAKYKSFAEYPGVDALIELTESPNLLKFEQRDLRRALRTANVGSQARLSGHQIAKGLPEVMQGTAPGATSADANVIRDIKRRFAKEIDASKARSRRGNEESHWRAFMQPIKERAKKKVEAARPLWKKMLRSAGRNKRLAITAALASLLGGGYGAYRLSGNSSEATT